MSGDASERRLFISKEPQPAVPCVAKAGFSPVYIFLGLRKKQGRRRRKAPEVGGCGRTGLLQNERTGGPRARPVCEACAKAPDVENFAWLPVGVNSDKPACGSVSLI